ncbi:MAG TPA: hypothetical protein VGK43_06330 [Solirubrobacterales bacterium]
MRALAAAAILRVRRRSELPDFMDYLLWNETAWPMCGGQSVPWWMRAYWRRRLGEKLGRRRPPNPLRRFSKRERASRRWRKNPNPVRVVYGAHFVEDIARLSGSSVPEVRASLREKGTVMGDLQAVAPTQQNKTNQHQEGKS